MQLGFFDLRKGSQSVCRSLLLQIHVYAGKEELPKVLGGLGIAILSTNKGVITDKEARKLQVGGEVLAFVW